MKSIINILVLGLIGTMSTVAYAQESTIIEGYAYENGNRGYLDVVQVTAVVKSNNTQVAQVYTNADGFFTFEAPAGQALEVTVVKDMFQSKSMDLTPEAGKKNFMQFELKREPGYIFEITMAEKRDDEETPVDAISGTRVEVYNNTTKEELLELNDYEHPEFRVNLQKGNHYTILIRKEGYLAKRMEAFVNVKGCILCFEGIGDVRPGVSETMTEGNDNGLLLANVSLEKVFTGKKLEIENIYYDLAKWDIKPKAEEQLTTVIQLMKDNPKLKFELGSHTDSRGKDAYNMNLSQKRAGAAVDFLKSSGNVNEENISYRGYGETQISNKCKNGVTCTEAMHAVNRRTELKVTSMSAEGREKSLVQMKSEEQFEEEMLSGTSANSDQIEVRPGETIDDALARIKLGKTEKIKLPVNDGATKAADTKDGIVKHMSHDVTGGLDQATEAQVEEVEKVEVEEVAKVVEEEVAIMEEVEDTKVKVVEDTKVKEVVEEVLEVIEKSAVIEEVVKGIEKSEEIAEVEKPSSGGLSGLKVDVPQLSENVDGVFISVYNGKKRLPLTHKVYKTFPDLNWYPSSDGNIYYVIDRVYPSEAKAQSYIDDYVKADYPDAQVLRFVKGIRRK